MLLRCEQNSFYMLPLSSKGILLGDVAMLALNVMIDVRVVIQFKWRKRKNTVLYLIF